MAPASAGAIGVVGSALIRGGADRTA